MIEGKFLKRWKSARLVIIEKDKKHGETETKYRLLCLINELGKLLEHLLAKRVREEIHKSGDLAELQFDFCPGKSTVVAIFEVQKKLTLILWRQKGHLVSLDVQNAFNMTPSKNDMLLSRRENVDGRRQENGYL